MAKHSAKKNEIRSSRLTLSFFHCLLLCGLLWLENFAYYRFDYIFRGMLPWILPIAFLLSSALLVVLLRFKRKDETPKVFSKGYLTYLALPLPALFLFPWLASFGKGLQLYKIAVILLLIGVIAYFIGFLLYQLIRPAAVLLCSVITANAMALTYFYRMYLSPARYILNAEEFGYLPAWAAALILCGILGIFLLGALYFNHLKHWVQKPLLVAPTAFTALLLLFTTVADPWLSGSWIRILLFGGIGLMVLCLILHCVWLCLKKK